MRSPPAPTGRWRVVFASDGGATSRGAAAARALRVAGCEGVWTGWPERIAALERIAEQEAADVVVIDGETAAQAADGPVEPPVGTEAWRFVVLTAGERDEALAERVREAAAAARQSAMEPDRLRVDGNTASVTPGGETR